MYYYQSYEQNSDENAKNKLLTSEMNRRVARLKVMTNESIWQYREQPPEDWNSPLPDALKATEKDLEIIQSSSSTCSIM